MKSLILSGLILFYSCDFLQAQDWKITNVLQGDSIAFASLRYSADEKGVAAVDSKGQVKWQVHIPGLVLGMSRFNGNLIAFYTQEFKDEAYKEIKEIHAAVIVVNQHKISMDKVIFTNEKKLYAIPYVVNDTSGNFSCLLVRNTPNASSFFVNNTFEKRSESTSIFLVTVSENLSASVKPLNSALVGGKYAGNCAGNQHDFYISGCADGQYIVERFDMDGKLMDKLSTNVADRNKPYPEAKISLDKFSTNSIDVYSRYHNTQNKRVFNLMRFDFEAHKVIQGTEIVLNKEFAEHLNSIKGENAKYSNLKRVEDFVPIQLTETSEKIVSIIEIQYVYSLAQKGSALRFTRDDAVINIYDKQAHLSREVVINKSSESFVDNCNTVGGAIKDGKLLVFTREIDRPLSYSSTLYAIDLVSGSIISKTTIDHNGLGQWMVDPELILWFSQNFVIPYQFGKQFFSRTYNTKLQTQSYP